MNNQKKIQLKGFPYKDHVLFAFPINEIIELFGTDKIEFECTIVNDKLILTSPPIRTSSSMKHTPKQMEVFTNA